MNTRRDKKIRRETKAGNSDREGARGHRSIKRSCTLMFDSNAKQAEKDLYPSAFLPMKWK